MSEQKRLFFGISLPEESKKSIVKWRSDTFTKEAGRPVAAANLHLTLAFLGDISLEKSLALQQLAARVKQPGFTLALDDAGHWPRSGVVWLGPKRSPRGLLQLAEMLRSQAARCGCYQSPTPFHPHVTLLRNATRPVALPPPNFHWPFHVERFALFMSVFCRGRTAYQRLAEWDLELEKR
ncbi:RNA 2',3'-cyclic phosphodiesterase [Erwinia psidii]|uniref:RNA 2',3'-cyclic phosphodiesterase n=1 Tax=Erwinia psidii TaxID=69224 RepID=A0A3N6RYZ1_9GAMM|nr:RNA 2',3'-cyclic phosphodiesterase [Erwinia psidii]MCX8957782.1 RNA 2',3'-cyclic phosphodiesterase [Erwinia psidii]MCX8960831.1 RNA 2',3'-cyclic phosphodiesterase [Erwinia psidii]MCX8964929.1 RNA 2',3'-cyclic phosphodiesterase [Erwinia psidii]RQM38398.1 RNA 2',3'-cyclic phosphodiesterase [Erwinia psidii]